MSGDSDDSASMAFVWIEPLIEQADVILAVRQVARSSAVRITQSLEELCPVHRVPRTPKVISVLPFSSRSTPPMSAP